MFMKISVVIPAYNEEAVIGKTLTAYSDFLAENFDDFEIIAVNDGSTDRTGSIIRTFSGVTCISYSQNRGKGYAVKRGILRATGDYIFFTDADLSYAPENISRAISLFEKKLFSGVVGVRENLRRDYPVVRRVLSRAFARLVRLVLKVDLVDTQCGFKAFDKTTGKQIFSALRIFDFGFDFEVIYLSKIFGKRLAALPVSFNHRDASHVHLIADAGRALRDLFHIKRRKMHEFIKIKA